VAQTQDGNKVRFWEEGIPWRAGLLLAPEALLAEKDFTSRQPLGQEGPPEGEG